MSGILSFTIIIAIFWFILYWVLGGVAFSILAMVRLAKMRKTRFSCLFTLTAAACALGASRTGLLLARNNVRTCLEGVDDRFERLASVIACGILEEVAAGIIWFLLLLLIGTVIMVLARADNQSWIDTDHDLDTELDELLEV
jgi:hypothetical protein